MKLKILPKRITTSHNIRLIHRNIYHFNLFAEIVIAKSQNGLPLYLELNDLKNFVRNVHREIN